MIDTAHRAILFALYQLSIAAGIVLLPLAVLTSRFGVVLPLHRLVDGLGDAYENARAA